MLIQVECSGIRGMFKHLLKVVKLTSKIVIKPYLALPENDDDRFSMRLNRGWTNHKV